MSSEKKVSLFKQKMQAKKAEQSSVQQQQTSQSVEPVAIQQQSAFPEAVKLSSEEIQANIVQSEIQQAQSQVKGGKQSMRQMLGISDDEYSSISKENDELLKNMKEEEIIRLQKELFQVLDPNLLNAFKKNVNEHPAAINLHKQDLYGLQMDNFITQNEAEIGKVFEMEVKTPQDALIQACFDKNGKLMLDKTLENKSAMEIEGDETILDSFKLLTLNKLLDNPNRQFNSIALETLERLITQMRTQIKTHNKGDFLFQVESVKVFRLDLIYFLESELSLTFTLCRCLTIPHATLNMSALGCLRNYLEFIMIDELVYYKQFLSKIQTEIQKKRYKAYTQIFIDEFLLRSISYLLNNLFLGDRSTSILCIIIDILDYVVYMDSEFFLKRIQDFGFVEQIKAFGGKEMEPKLEFLKFELGRLDNIYENIPLIDSTYHLIRESKYKIGSVSLENYCKELNNQIQKWSENKADINTLKAVRDLLIFGEKTQLIRKIRVNTSKIFQFNRSIVENTIFMLLELNSVPENLSDDISKIVSAIPKEEDQSAAQQNTSSLMPSNAQLQNFFFQSEEFKNSFAQTYNQEDLQYLVEGMIQQESKGIPHSIKGVVERVIPLDIQIMFKYHYLLKEKKSGALSNHLEYMQPFLLLLIKLYSELNFQMKYIILLKTRKALQARSIFNECFSDILRVIIIELVQFLTLKSLPPSNSLAFDIKNSQWQTALSAVSLLREIKQKEALISVLNISKQLSLKSESLKIFDALANFTLNLSAKNNKERMNKRLEELIVFFSFVNDFVQLLEPSSHFYYHPELLFVRICKLFDDHDATFTQINEDQIDSLFQAVSNKADVNRYAILISKNSDIPQKIVTNFNYNSFGNKSFTKLVFFLLQKPFDLKMKKKILMETVLSYAFLFSQNCQAQIFGKETNYLKRISSTSDQKIKLRFECEEIQNFLSQNDIDSTSRSSFFNRFLHNQIGAELNPSLPSE